MFRLTNPTMSTPSKTNMSPRKGLFQKERMVFQALFFKDMSVFRGESWVWPPPRIPVTTRIITFLIGNRYKPSFATVTGRGPHPRCIPFAYVVCFQEFPRCARVGFVEVTRKTSRCEAQYLVFFGTISGDQ